MALEHRKQTVREKGERIEKQLEASLTPARRLIEKGPTVDKDDPRAFVQPSRQKHPRRPAGP